MCTVSCDGASGCEACKGVNTKCLNCRAGYFWKGSEDCDLCTGKTGKATDTEDKTGNTAETCGTTCTTLSGCDACEGDESTCLNCRAGWVWQGASGPKKCSLCNIGTGKAVDTEDKLLAKPTTDESLTCATTCTLGCGVCTGTNTECVNCRAGYFWAGSNTCTLCSGKKGKADDSDDKTGTPSVTASACATTCDTDSGCDACKGDGTTCLNCRAGYLWKGASGQTCSLCPSGKGKLADTATDKLLTLPTTDDADAVCGVTCTSGCNVCTGDATKCLNCEGGYFWFGTQSCKLCSGRVLGRFWM